MKHFPLIRWFVSMALMLFFAAGDLCFGESLSPAEDSYVYPDNKDAFRIKFTRLSEAAKFSSGNLSSATAEVSRPFLKGIFDVRELDFYAVMPEHKHGMVTKAKIKKISANRFKIDGIKFHMPGFWELHFVFVVDGKRHHVVMPFSRL